MSHTLPKISFWQGVNNRKNIEYEIYFIHHYVNEIRIPAISRIYNWCVFMFWFIHIQKDETKNAYLYEKLFLTRFSDHLKISI